MILYFYYFKLNVKKRIRIEKKEKEKEIQKWSNLKGKELFDTFNLDEKINNIKLNPSLASLSTTIN